MPVTPFPVTSRHTRGCSSSAGRWERTTTRPCRGWRATKDLIRAAAEDDVPTLGICLGHQLAAVALGGVVEPDPAGKTVGVRTVAWNAAAAHRPVGQLGRRSRHVGGAVEQRHRRGGASGCGRRPRVRLTVGCRPRGSPRPCGASSGIRSRARRRRPVGRPRSPDCGSSLLDVDTALADVDARADRLRRTWQPLAARFARCAAGGGRTGQLEVLSSARTHVSTSVARIFLQTRAVAMAARPSRRPVTPRPSVVVPLTETGAPGRAARLRFLRRDPIGSRLPITWTATLPISKPASRTSRAASPSKARPEAPAYCGPAGAEVRSDIAHASRREEGVARRVACRRRRPVPASPTSSGHAARRANRRPEPAAANACTSTPTPTPGILPCHPATAPAATTASAMRACGLVGVQRTSVERQVWAPRVVLPLGHHVGPRGQAQPAMSPARSVTRRRCSARSEHVRARPRPERAPALAATSRHAERVSAMGSPSPRRPRNPGVSWLASHGVCRRVAERSHSPTRPASRRACGSSPPAHGPPPSRRARARAMWSCRCPAAREHDEDGAAAEPTPTTSRPRREPRMVPVDRATVELVRGRLGHGLDDQRSMLTCCGRPTTNATHAATSSATSGRSTSAYTLSAAVLVAVQGVSEKLLGVHHAGPDVDDTDVLAVQLEPRVSETTDVPCLAAT